MSLFLVRPSFASDNFSGSSFATVVNPVRGSDFWALEDQEPLTAVKDQLRIIKANDFPATWLLRPDLILEKELVDFFRTVPQNHELGIFLEVTPVWTDPAGVEYHQESLWHRANSVFLSGYTVEERKKLIDTAFQEFKAVFDYYPQSVGAWHIDAHSLAYMQENYGVVAAMICADQFLTDDYQIWGGWWGVPYYPSSYNALLPAQSEKSKLDLVIFQWASRDPVHGYGGGVQESTYSVQANDYLKHDLKTDYFSHLVDSYTRPAEGKFGQITIGLENDNLWETVGGEYESQIKTISDKKSSVVTMTDFSRWYREQFPGLSLPHKIEGRDFLGGGKKATWLMSTDGRVGLLEEGGEIFLRDWRLYHEKWSEPYLEVANKSQQLKVSLPAKIDAVRFPSQMEELDQDPQKLLKKKLTLPFATPKFVSILTVSIFIGFLLWGFRLDKKILPLMFFGMGIQTVTMIKSGLLYSFGMGFWGPNGHDGIWHLALIEQLTRHFPPQNPVFAGQALFNYHYLFDLLVALVNKLTGLPVVNLYFQVFPVVFSGFLGILTYLLMKKLSEKKLVSFLAVFLVYFGGSWGWLVTFLRGQGFGGESMFWANQAVSFLINPPFALSIILILLGLGIFIDYLKEATGRRLIILSLIFGGLIGVKSYAGGVILVGLLAAASWQIIKERKKSTLKLFLTSLIISLIIFLPSAHKASGLFLLGPFWFSRTMLIFSDRLNWPRLDQARHAYLSGKRWLRWFLAEGLALAIFFVGNLGTRVIFIGKLFEWAKSFKKVCPFRIFLGGCLFTSGVIPLFFIQKGNPWNSIQFFYYFLFFAALLAAWWMGEILTKKKAWARRLSVAALVLLTIPTTLGTMKHYLPPRSPARISFDELEALEFLRRQPEGAVLSYPHDYWLRENVEAPKPVYAYETTAYVSAFSGKTSFLEDEMNLEIMQVDWRPRREKVEKFFETTEPTWAREFLQENNIRFVYLVGDQSFFPNPVQLELVKIFENGLVRIYEFHGKIEG